MIRIQKDRKVGKIATKSSETELPKAEKATNSCKLATLPAKKATKEKTESPYSPATQAALRILQAGANSSKMLREKLMRKGFEADDCEETLLFLQEQGLLDDQRLLQNHVLFLAERRFYGKARIRLELFCKFDRAVVDECLEEALEGIDFEALCFAAAKKSKGKGREALMQKLRRQGYATSEIRYALAMLEKTED